jgi:enoyl-[acyl-carrier protein] reductase III
MEDIFSLQGKTLLIAGGTRGIGRAISKQFVRAGARVVANYVRDEHSAEALRSEMDKEGHSILLCRADLTSPQGLANLDRFMAENSEYLSGMVYCAATGIHRPLEELTARHYEWTFALNVRGFFDLIKLLLPRFKPPAAIVALSSQGAVQAMPAYTLVGASKGALESLARHLAMELAPRRIRVNILSPGTVLTKAWEVMPDREGRLAEARRRSPIGRLIEPEEVARAAQFLCSEASAGMIGHTLVVDGGLRLVGA